MGRMLMSRFESILEKYLSENISKAKGKPEVKNTTITIILYTYIFC